MFYLKYRPKNIDELDNAKVKEIITKILKAGSFPHAFLFVGQKGTGKTSTARIFAKAINCLENKFGKKDAETIEPCNHCTNCLSIDHSNSVDVVEMDAASNRGIDEIKKLIHETNFLPMTCRYRVFIIDEAHMITPEAFNALLKTLEEPPPAVIFIFATTNKDKLPKTIISRCQIVNFGKANKTDIIRMLNRLTQGENIKVDKKLLELIAEHSDNSFRDAAKILEELTIQQKLDFEAGKKFLGLSKKNFLDVLNKKNIKDVLAWIEEFSQNNGNFKTLIEETLNDLRILLLKNNGLVIEKTPVTEFNQKELVELIKLLTEAYQNLKITPIESLPLEIAVLEFYNKKINS
jgi:DNA polymerase-3 subunit gamma/tau